MNYLRMPSGINKIVSIFLATIVSSFISAHALTISPARLDISGDPGQTVSGDFQLINEQDSDQVFYSSSENFSADGESGTPNFTTGDSGLASWISVQNSVALAKGQRVKVPFTITIPKDADAGGYFAAIFLSTVPPSTKEGEVAVGAKIGMLVLLKVNGDIKEGGGIVDFAEKTKKTILTSLPITFTYRFTNSGNDRVNPVGDITIRDMIGLEVAQLSANPSQGNVLPQSTRRFDVTWGTDSSKNPYKTFFDTALFQFHNFAFGYYKVDMKLSYGVSSSADASTSVIVFPWQLLLITTIGLIVLLFILSRGIKRYNRWIISQAHSIARQ